MSLKESGLLYSPFAILTLQSEIWKGQGDADESKIWSDYVIFGVCDLLLREGNGDEPERGRSRFDEQVL